jgi:protein tyrosine/serine phosphatase
VVFVCALAALVTTGVAQSAPTFGELPNFHKVTEKLYRGGQPQSGGMKRLAQLRIRSVINLRGEDEMARREQKEAESANLRYFNVSLPGLGAPSDEQVARVMALIDNPENQPVFIHCKRGSDRTGTIVALYRISHEGWTAQRAVAEAKTHGMSWIEFGMRSYIKNYYKQRIAAQARPVPATSY